MFRITGLLHSETSQTERFTHPFGFISQIYLENNRRKMFSVGTEAKTSHPEKPSDPFVALLSV